MLHGGCRNPNIIGEGSRMKSYFASNINKKIFGCDLFHNLRYTHIFLGYDLQAGYLDVLQCPATENER